MYLFQWQSDRGWGGAREKEICHPMVDVTTTAAAGVKPGESQEQGLHLSPPCG